MPDIRNSKGVDIYAELASFGLNPLVHDPMADAQAVTEEYGFQLSPLDDFRGLHALILAVPHSAFDGLDGNSVSDMLATKHFRGREVAIEAGGDARRRYLLESLTRCACRPRLGDALINSGIFPSNPPA